jgi:kynurenine 3-monooxygenase
MRAQQVSVVGAGLAGALLAVLLARRGFAVTLYDRRPDPRVAHAEAGRSINLALAARGIRALERAGMIDAVRPLLIEMRGRCVHDRNGATSLHPYGWRPGEVIHSVGRASLNRLLIEEAAKHSNVTFRFEHACLGANAKENTLLFRDHAVALAPTIATDGAGSAIRASLAISVREELLDHDYKELSVPPGSILEGNALHVWPRGGFMLIALPNTDGSFTATLFLSRQDFAAITDVRAFFQKEFADVVPLLPDLTDQFARNPQGQMGTVYTKPWHVDGKVLLLGDAAHAIVPFHGQGMNAAFEDCIVFDELLDSHDDWTALFAEVERRRRPNADAIAQMALENYIEMRDTVLDPKFQRHKALAVELEKRFPDRFIPRYSMVMFHPEIPYAEALRRGAVQAQILDEMDDVDSARTRELVETRLTELGPAS